MSTERLILQRRLDNHGFISDDVENHLIQSAENVDVTTNPRMFH